MTHGTYSTTSPNHQATLRFPLIHEAQLFDVTGVGTSKVQPYVRSNLLWAGISAMEHEAGILKNAETVSALGRIVTEGSLKDPAWETLQEAIYSADPNEVAVAGLALTRMSMVVDGMRAQKTGQPTMKGINLLDIYAYNQDPDMSLENRNEIADIAGLPGVDGWRVHDIYRPKSVNSPFQCARSVIAIDREDRSSVTWATTVEVKAHGVATIEGSKTRIPGLDSTIDSRNAPISYSELLDVGNTLAATI